MILFGQGWMFTGAHFITAPQGEGRDPVFLPVTEPIYYTCGNNVDLRDGGEALFRPDQFLLYFSF